MKTAVNLVGKRFGRWIVLSFYLKDENRRYKWLCKCDCGEEKVVFGINLTRGLSQSCGCLNRENLLKALTKHGQAKAKNQSSEYAAWCEMKQRCADATQKNYGGRGIGVCDRWLDSFENFFADMGKKPSPLHSLDRYPDNDGNYELGNCRWATDQQQAGNTRRNHWIEYNGKRMILEDWAREFNTDKNSILKRVKLGLPLDTKKIPTCIVLDTQTGVFYDSIADAARSVNYTYQNLVKRLNGEVRNNTSFIKV